ncbi:MAG: hypothetical protein K5798_09525 [Nitrosopumilus sp.]|uniref:hypothetical protein n=1 Tax=Nitrosopumilus sp. TaxID=2024843 RepID=UPI00242A638D|nr:hypothetical protein [Nitrosopumilus sp.]MCV0367483.1 hypothetical protein [Nitrosopumilus sp.]
MSCDMPKTGISAELLRFSDDGKSVFVRGRKYDLDDNASLSLLACPQSIEETMKQWE